jgi:hypothetical protein
MRLGNRNLRKCQCQCQCQCQERSKARCKAKACFIQTQERLTNHRHSSVLQTGTDTDTDTAASPRLGASGSHADHLDLLKEFSLGSNRWRNDDFSLLKLSEIGSADVSHTGGDGSNQVLAPVVHIRRTE